MHEITKLKKTVKVRIKLISPNEQWGSSSPYIYTILMWMLCMLWLAVAHYLLEYRYIDDVTTWECLYYKKSSHSCHRVSSLWDKRLAVLQNV